MKLINGNQETEHPAVLPLLLASLALIFQLQEAGMHLNVALQGGSRENVFPGEDGIFLLPADIDEEMPVYVLGIRKETAASSASSTSSTTRTPARTPARTPTDRAVTIQGPGPTPQPQLQVPRSDPFSGR